MIGARQALEVAAVSFAVVIASWPVAGWASRRGYRVLRALAAAVASLAAWLVLVPLSYLLFRVLATAVNRFETPCSGCIRQPDIMPIGVAYGAALGVPTLMVGLYWGLRVRPVAARIAIVLGVLALATAMAAFGIAMAA